MELAKEARMDERIKRITDSIPEKMFFDPSFEAPSRNGLLADVALQEGKSVFTREQEYQIFRKYNYLKYRVTLSCPLLVLLPLPEPTPWFPRFLFVSLRYTLGYRDFPQCIICLLYTSPSPRD